MIFSFVDNSKKVIDEKNKKVEAALNAIGIQAEKYAKLNLENHPRRIDTGLLRNSIAYAVEGQEPSISTYTSDDKTKSGSYSGTAGSPLDRTVYIGTNVEYAVYVHEGTDRMAANRFLRNAAALHSAEYMEIAKRYLKNG